MHIFLAVFSVSALIQQMMSTFRKSYVLMGCLSVTVHNGIQTAFMKLCRASHLATMFNFLLRPKQTVLAWYK